MARETLVPRYYGSETEYGPRLPKGSEPTYEWKVPPDTPHIGAFLQNGGKLYPDGSFVEYATPTCHTLGDLVTHDLAGEELVWDAYGNGKTKTLALHKRCSAPDSNNPSDTSKQNNIKDSSGTHENYAALINIWEPKEKIPMSRD